MANLHNTNHTTTGKTANYTHHSCFSQTEWSPASKPTVTYRRRPPIKTLFISHQWSQNEISTFPADLLSDCVLLWRLCGLLSFRSLTQSLLLSYVLLFGDYWLNRCMLTFYELYEFNSQMNTPWTIEAHCVHQKNTYLVITGKDVVVTSKHLVHIPAVCTYTDSSLLQLTGVMFEVEQ